MPHYKLALIGFGNVGRALARLLERKRDELRSRYDITFSISGIATGRHGFAIDPDGLDLQKALDLIEQGETLSPLSVYPVEDAISVIQKSGADVMFENTPVNHKTGQPAIDHVRAALNAGMHVATANKGTVVHAYRELTELAASTGRKFYHESTVMDGAPIFSLFRGSLPAAQLLSLRGVLNSTTNLILTRMEAGESFDRAVEYAQQIGLAETDPSADVDGWDAAIKVAALVTALMGIPLTPQQVDRTGIREITPQMVEQARGDGKRWKLVCSVEKDGETVSARVAPELVPISSPLYSIDGSTSIIEFETDVLGKLSIVEKDPGPDTTAYGLLADFVNMATGR